VFKLQQIIGEWFNKILERSLQKNADKQFDKYKIEYRDGDNT
jgi:hypothetical protein